MRTVVSLLEDDAGEEGLGREQAVAPVEGATRPTGQAVQATEPAADLKVLRGQGLHCWVVGA